MYNVKQLFTRVSVLFLLVIALYPLVRSVILTPPAFAAPTVTEYTVLLDNRNQPTIQVSGTGSNVTLPEIYAGLGGISQTYLLALDNNTWRLNINLLIGTEVTLTVSPQTGVQELQLRSGNNQITDTAIIDYNSFVYLKSQNGAMFFDSIKLYSWDVATNKVDENYANGRAYLLAKGAATMTISNTEISYLGSGDGESYGVSWRDVNDSANPTLLRTRVTGDVFNSDIHHNYYGIYTFQGQNMRFVGNEVHHNVRYGFDPHDFTHDVLIENNLTYNNGAHGLIISRGCSRFTIRNNRSFDNVSPGTTLAHGFMLDPGSPTGEGAQVPSTDNLLENNEAYGNDGYGLRILISNQNQFRNNSFHHNSLGVSVDSQSQENIISDNQVYSNTTSGFFLKESSQNNTIDNNQIYGNGGNGIQIRANDNIVSNNTIRQNSLSGVAFALGSLAEVPTNNQIITNTIINNFNSGVDLRNAERNLIAGNVIANSNFHGVSFGGSAKQNHLRQNIIRHNNGQGIAASGALAISNTWSQNSIYANLSGGILLTLAANQNIAAPILTGVVNTTLSGQAQAGAIVEIFSDGATQGQYYEGQTIADSSGLFTFSVASAWQNGNLTAITSNSASNASSFSAPLQTAAVATPIPTTDPTVGPTQSATPVPSSTPATAIPTPRETSNPTPQPTTTTTVEQPTVRNYLPTIYH